MAVNRNIPFVLTAHAVTVIGERGIQVEWVARVLENPAAVEFDRSDPTVRHALGRIAEREGRVLRVVYDQTVTPWRIITAFFDRRRRNSL